LMSWVFGSPLRKNHTRPGGVMEKQTYSETVRAILDATHAAVEDIRRCLASHDKQCLKKAETEVREMLTSSLPIVTELMSAPEKDDLEKKFLMLVPSLQRIGMSVQTLLARVRTKLESDILFTDKGLNELKQVTSGIKDLVRDAKDVLTTGNPHLRREMKSEMEKLIRMADDFALEHQERLITGLCTPRASYLYVDMMDALRRVALELVHVAEKG
jgi:phosphate:Na+ symporter